MLEKLKENKKIIVITLIILGAVLAWWQSKDVEPEAKIDPKVEEVVNE
tara:strand:+ start:544 stop:687 length:144 start_codon:yes stop_codon:yes gene_type:complete